MIVRGDGTLMSAVMAQDRPVDTLLSGPAASIVGAKHLSGQDNALVVDIGGTTTDMAILKNGAVELDPHGATVGPWKTHVEAANIRTFGLGGDSLISFNDYGGLFIGPRRVVPLAVLAQNEPGVVSDLEAILRRAPSRNGKSNPCLFYAKCRPLSKCGLDSSLPVNLDAGPVSEQSIMEDAKRLPYLWRIKRSEGKGLILCAGLTPTDVRVALGKFRLGRRRAAELGLKILAQRLGVDEAAAVEAVEENIRRRLCVEAVSFVGNGQGQTVAEVADLWFARQPERGGVGLDVRVALSAPVVGSGAPAACCLPAAFERLHTECILPETHAVTGAVGSVVGMVSQTFTAVIRVSEGKGYSLHSPRGRETFDQLDKAEERGRQLLEELAMEQMARNHVTAPVMDFDLEERKAKSATGQEIHFESILRVRATGRPAVG